MVRHLRRIGAISPEGAQDYSPRHFLRKRALGQLLRSQIVKRVGERFYLDEDMWRMRRKKRRKFALSVFTIGAAALAVTALGGRA